MSAEEVVSLPYKFTAEQIINEGRTTKEAIDQIKEWLVTTKFPKLCDEMIVLFLLSCDNVIDNTKNTIIAYFEYKQVPELYDNRDIDEEEELRKELDAVMASSLPVRTEANETVHFFRLLDTNYRNFDLATTFKLAYMIADVSQNHNPSNGFIIICDMEGAGYMHLTRLRLNLSWKAFEFLQDGLHLKLTKLYSNYITEKIFYLFKHVIKSDLLKKLEFIPTNYSMEEFHKKHLPARFFPKEYGGDLPTCLELNQRTLQQFREMKPFFEAEEKLRKTYHKTYRYGSI